MKRFSPLFLLIFVLLLMPSMTALAAETEKTPSHVTITVVMPDPTKEQSQPEGSAPTLPYIPELDPAPAETPATASAVPKLYPTGVYDAFENGVRWIVKTYELTPDENPADIPRDNFERDSWAYSLTDITKKETAATDVRDYVEIATLNTETKEMEAILRQLSPTLEYTSEDGYSGILTLDVSTIKVETAGTKSSSYTASATREYPHLSSNDTSLVPKTITDNGKTLSLSSVTWKTQTAETVDYNQLPSSYTAVATYTATASKTVVTGYTTTAEYRGKIAKLNQGKTVYTAYFIGAEIVPERTPLEIIKPTPEPETAEPDIETEDETDTEAETDTDTTEQPEATEQPGETEQPSETEAPEEQPADAEADADANPWTLIILGGLLILIIGVGVGYCVSKITNKSTKKGESIT